MNPSAEARARQSVVRVRSGLKLVAFLALVAIVAFLLGVAWLAKLAGVAAGFFVVVTALEAWNARRLRRGQH